MSPVASNNAPLMRYTLGERILHWVAALAYLYVLLTGLAFWSPKLFWMADALGGGPVVRAWHPCAGLLFIFSVLWMWKKWRKDMRTTAADKMWRSQIGRYVRNEDEQLPPIGRFNFGQKQFFWIMFWAGILLLLSGVVMWFTEYIPWDRRLFRQGSVLVHAIAFLFTAAAFIVHIYMGTAVVRGGFTSIIRGEVSRPWAKTHHALWYAEITGNEPKQ